MTQGRSFFGGLPTAPDVTKLMEHFGTPPAGVIPYTEIEAVIGAAWKSTRFKTVVGAWRQRLFREHNLSTEAEVAQGIRVLSEPERIGKSTRIFRTGGRRIRAAVIEGNAIRVEKLTAPDRTRADHFQRVATRVYEAVTTGAKELAPPRPLRQLPSAVVSERA